VTLREVLHELHDAGLLARTKRVRCGEIELELSAPEDTERKTMVIETPHGTGISENEAKKLEELELREGLYGAAGGYIPSDYGPA